MIIPIKNITRIRKEHAQTMVEFALVFPIILLITYGIIEFGRMVFIYAAVTGSAREGARYGAASGAINGTRFYKDCTGIIGAVQRGSLLTTIDPANIDIWYDNGPNPTQTWANCPPVGSDGLDPIMLGDRILVHVEACYEPIIDFVGVVGGDCSDPTDPDRIIFEAENGRTILLNVESKK